jgi:TolA-binding protein
MPTIKKRGAASPRKQEQEIVTIAHIVTDFLVKYRRQFMIAGSVVALVIVLAAGYAIVQAERERKAGPLVAAAYEAYDPSNGSAADYGKALEQFREVEKKYSGARSAAIAQYYIGNSLVNMGRPEEAIKEYQAFVRKYAGEKFLLGLVHQRMGYVHQGLGKQEEARKS